MEDCIELKKINEIYYKVIAERSVIAELGEYFTVFVPGYRFMPKFKAKIWDGKVRFLNRANNTIYCGLIDSIKQFCNDRKYDLIVEQETNDSITNEELSDFLSRLNFPYEPHDYQINAFMHGIKNKRTTIISPTASGKSGIIYSLAMWFIQNTDQKALIVVPTTSLVEQLYKNFEEYSVNNDFNTENSVHRIYSGHDKNTDKQVMISTWQSLFRMPPDYFENIGFVLIDETHLAAASSLKKILEQCVNAKYRFGATGTLQGAKALEHAIIGLLGPVYTATTTKELMDSQKLAELKIKCVVLDYSIEDCLAVKKFNYPEEIGYIISHSKRNRYVCKLASTLAGNTLVLFQYVKKHGVILHEMIKEIIENSENKHRKVFYVAGSTDAEEREMVRQLTETEKDSIIVASSGVFSTGINIKNLENIVFASPSKSRIRTLQSIGRVLRIGRSNKATLYDIVDNLQHKAHKNFAIKHFLERVQIYDSEEFDYRVFQIKL